MSDRLVAAVAEHRLVNVTGPPGVGKTRLVGELPGTWTVDLDDGLEALPEALADPGAGLVVVDGVDGPRRVRALRDALDATPDGGPSVTVVVSRRPLAAQPQWGGREAAQVVVPPVPDAVIAELAGARCTDPAVRELAVRMAGGVPFLAEAVCRAVLGGASVSATGAVADHVAGEVLERLVREAPGRRWQHALRLLATVGSGDEHLLTGGPELFDLLAGLSIVTRRPLGLAVVEPYRHLFELAYRWRDPTAHDVVRSRASAYRVGLLATTREPEERAELAEQGLFLTGDPHLHRALFPPAPGLAAVEPARADDAGSIGSLMRQWAVRGGFDVRRAEHLTESWQTGAFHVARDGDGRVIGLASLLSMGECVEDGIEPLLQQHAEAVVDAGRGGGLFLGAAFCPDQAVHAHILRHILREAVRGGSLVVSTATPEYQALLHTLGFRQHGSVRDDVYRCGRHPQVYSNDMHPAALPQWLRGIARGRLLPGADPADVRRQIAHALAHLHDSRALTASPLLGHPRTATVAALRSWLRDAVQLLAGSEDPIDAEAGTVLQTYYLGRASTHQHVAARLHLSRATYFRRLGRGLAALADMALTPAAP